MKKRFLFLSVPSRTAPFIVLQAIEGEESPAVCAGKA